MEEQIRNKIQVILNKQTLNKYKTALEQFRTSLEVQKISGTFKEL